MVGDMNLDVWSLPTTGSPWCDCGKYHEVTAGFVYSLVVDECGHDVGTSVSHQHIRTILLRLWRQPEETEDFREHLQWAVEMLNGSARPCYDLVTGIDIIGLFTKTWRVARGREADR